MIPMFLRVENLPGLDFAIFLLYVVLNIGCRLAAESLLVNNI